MITYLQLHPNMRLVVGLVLLVALAGTVAWLYLRYVAFTSPLEFDEWQRDPDLPGQPQSMPAPLAGELYLDPDTWDHLDPDQAADILIAEWHDEPPADWPAAPDVWDAWWASMDGLERECLKVTRLRQREQQLWAELKAETRELCGVAA